MTDAPSFPASALFALPVILLVPALAVTLAASKKAQNAIGRAIAARRPGLWTRRLLLVGTQAAVLAWVSMRGDADEGPAAEILLLGILVTWLAPGQDDAVLGETGVQRGWIARRFEQLEEWQLAGDHLRFRLFGEWTSVPCPLVDQPRIRETLEAVNAGRETQRPR